MDWERFYFQQVTCDENDNKIKLFLQFTRHQIVLTDVDTKVDIIGKSNKKVWSMWMEGQMRMNDCWYTIQDTK